MDGRRVVVGLVAGVVVLAAAIWSAGRVLTDAIDAQAEAEGVPRLTPEEAAERVAREDRFGLPSRLETPPPRDIEEFRKVGTAAAPLPPSDAGARRLLEAYAVTVELCAKRARTGVSGPVDLELALSGGHVSEVRAPGRSGEAWATFTRCTLGGLQPAFFESDGASALLVTVELP